MEKVLLTYYSSIMMNILRPLFARNHYWTGRPILLLAGLALLLFTESLAQTTIISFSPTRNQRNAPVNNNVAVTFDQPMANTPATKTSLKVFSNQRGGRMQDGARGTASVSGNTLTFDPTMNFKPGETISATVTTAAQSTGGQPLAQEQVFQFTTATSGTGQGNFQPSSEVSVSSLPRLVTMGDADGDGDLDLFTASANGGNTFVSVRLNDGNGTFSGGSDVSINYFFNYMVLGDVDGDGDLDFLTNERFGSTVGLHLNNGAGSFTQGPSVSVGSFTYSLALADVDGDGDLDLLSAENFTNTVNTVSVRLNDGTGNFGGGSEVTVGINSFDIQMGDVDNDGDMDMLVVNDGSGSISVRLNDGTGVFAEGSEVSLQSTYSFALGDVNGDGTLDIVASSDNTVKTLLNDGSGNFTNSSSVSDVPSFGGVKLGDVDGDGDLDLLTGDFFGEMVNIRLNDGSGNFTGCRSVSVVAGGLALGDADSDGDLDLLVHNANGNGKVAVLLNQPVPAPTVTTASPTNLSTGSATLGGDVTADGGVCVNERGVVYLVGSGTPTTSDTKVAIGSRTGTFNQEITGLSPGTLYSVRAYATNGTSISYGEPLTFTTLVNLSIVVNNQTNVSCFGGNDGSITVSASGGTPDYVYTLNPGGVQNSTGVFTGLTSGNYTVTVNDANSLSAITETITIAQPTAIVLNTSGDTSLSYGSNCTTLTASASGGTAPYSYVWQSAGTTLGQSASQQVCPQTTTTYTVTVTDANECSGQQQVTVTVNDVRCGNKNQNVTICYYGVTQCVSEKIAERYLKLGATLGGCGTNARIGVEESGELPLQLSLKAYPNPVQDAVTLEVLAPNAGTATFEVVDLTGRTRQSRSEVLVEGLNEVGLRLGSLPTGLYLIRATDARHRQGVVKVSKE